jgi:uncharacterized protein YpmS
MSRYQRVSLLVLALILVAVVVIAVLIAFPRNTESSSLPASNLTETWVVEFAATNQATLDAIGTLAVATSSPP